MTDTKELILISHKQMLYIKQTLSEPLTLYTNIHVNSAEISQWCNVYLFRKT